MKVFFAAFDTEMSTAELGRRRKTLAEQLKQLDIEFENISKSVKSASMVARIDADARGHVVVAIDDGCGVPEGADWFVELSNRASGLNPSHRPSIIYVSSGVAIGASVGPVSRICQARRPRSVGRPGR